MALQIEPSYVRQLLPTHHKVNRNETPLRERPNAKFRIKSELRGATKMPPIAPPHLNATVQLTRSTAFPGTKTPLRKVSGKDESGISNQYEENAYGEPATGHPKGLSIETSTDPKSLIITSQNVLRSSDNNPLNFVTSMTTKNTHLTPIFNTSFTSKSSIVSKPKGFPRRFADMQKSPLAIDKRTNISDAMTSTHERHNTSNSRTENSNFLSNPTPQGYVPTLDATRCSNKGCGPIKAYAANTNQGLVRNYNEDRVAIILNILKPPHVEYEGEWPLCSFFGIYDGHGGAECADFLRDNLHQLIIKDKNFPFNPVEALKNGFQEAERQFLEIAQKRYDEVNKSGSCAIVALFVDDTCYIANVGDSRAVMSSELGKKVTALSRDHKPNEDYERERIIENGGKIYQSQISMPMKPRSLLNHSAYTKTVLGPHRVFPGRLSVSRTFGDIEAKLPKYGGMPGVVVAEPDIMSYKLTGDNDFILIACDGIFDKMSDEDVVKAGWEPTRTRARDIHLQSSASVENILLESLIRRTFDNITGVMISLEGFRKAIFPENAEAPDRRGSNSPAKVTVDMLLEKNESEASRLQTSPLYNTLKKSLDTGKMKESRIYGFNETPKSAEPNPMTLSATLRAGAVPVNHVTQKVGEDGMLNFSIKRLSGTFRKPK